MLSKLALVLLSAPLLWPLSSQAADTPAAACDVQWQITPHLDASPRHLAVTLSFDAGNRTRSSVQLPSRWASVDDFGNFVTGLRSTDAQQSLDPVQGAAAERTIRHRPGERVVLQYQVTSPLVDADDNQPRSQTDTFRTRLARAGSRPLARPCWCCPTIQMRPRRNACAWTSTVVPKAAGGSAATAPSKARAPASGCAAR